MSTTATRDGGGVESRGAAPNIAACVFTENGAGNSGGGIGYYVEGGSFGASRIVNCSFLGNQADYGGAISNASPSLKEVTNCVFSRNTARSGGAAIDNVVWGPNVWNCTFSGNENYNAGGTIEDGTFFYTSMVLANCIVWGNVTPQGTQVQGSPTVWYSVVQGGFPGNGIIDADPRFIRPPTSSDYGDLRLRPNSPAIDAGDNVFVASGNVTDLAGNARIVDIPLVQDPGVYVDLGAYELQPILYVDATLPAGGTLDGGSWSTAYPTLQQALAVATNGYEIRVASGTYKPTSTTDRTANFQLKSGVVLLGGYAGHGAADPDARDVVAYPTVLSGDIGAVGNNSDNSYHVVYASGVAASATLDGFTITGGNANGTGLSAWAGGLYVLSSASPTIRNCRFIGNSAANSGGAIRAESASNPTIINCAFVGNTSSGTGGALANVTSSSPTLVNCTFVNNSALDGGAVYSNSSAPSFTNCAFTGNSASGRGGAVYHNLASPTFVDCTFALNAAANSGGGAFNTGSSPTFMRCTFNGNTSADTGGAVSGISSSSPALVNCVLVGNAALNGGAVYNNTSTTSLTNCTIAANAASGTGGAVYNNSGNPVLVNCVVWANTATTSAAFFNTGGSANVTYTDVQGGLAGTGNVSADPRFYRSPAKGADNAWGTADDDYGDVRLLPGSPCVDAGSNVAIPAGAMADLAGNPRTYDFPGVGTAGAATVDMGAYELTQNLGSLRVAAGQTVTLPAGGYAFSATQVIVDPGGTLDLADGSLLIDYTGGSPVAAVRSALLSGRNGGAWNGTGIVSSAARTTPNRGIGYAEAADLGLTTFAGQAVDSTTLLLKYTVAGDANLDGRINGDDYALTDRGRAKGLGTWVFGDFNYDAAVTSADYSILNVASAPPPAPAPVMVAPAVFDETDVAAPLAIVTAVVEATPAPSQVVAPAKPAAAPAKKLAPAKAKPAKPVPVAKPKAKPKPAAKAKPKCPPHAAVTVQKAPPAGKSAHPVSGRSRRG